MGTTYADDKGRFLIRGLASGTYDVSFAPNFNYLPATKSGVQVTIGNVTDVGTVTIESD